MKDFLPESQPAGNVAVVQIMLFFSSNCHNFQRSRNSTTFFFFFFAQYVQTRGKLLRSIEQVPKTAWALKRWSRLKWQILRLKDFRVRTAQWALAGSQGLQRERRQELKHELLERGKSDCQQQSETVTESTSSQGHMCWDKKEAGGKSGWSVTRRDLRFWLMVRKAHVLLDNGNVFLHPTSLSIHPPLGSLVPLRGIRAGLGNVHQQSWFCSLRERICSPPSDYLHYLYPEGTNRASWPQPASLGPPPKHPLLGHPDLDGAAP